MDLRHFWMSQNKVRGLVYLKIVVMRILHPSNDWCHRQRRYSTLIEVKLPCFGFNPYSVLNIQARNEGSAIFRYLCHQLTFAKVLTSIRKCFHIATATWIPNFPNYLSRPCVNTTKKKYFFLNVFNYEVLDTCCKYTVPTMQKTNGPIIPLSSGLIWSAKGILRWLW